MKKLFITAGLLMTLAAGARAGYYDCQQQSVVPDTTTVRNDWYYRGSFNIGKSSYVVNANAIPIYIILRDTGTIECIDLNASGNINGTFTGSVTTATYAVTAGTAAYADDAGALGGYAYTHFVDTTSAQSIAGGKTFSGAITGNAGIISTSYSKMNDGTPLYFGSSLDRRMYWNDATSELRIANSGDTYTYLSLFPNKLQISTQTYIASDGTNTDFSIDASSATFHDDVNIGAGKKLYFGIGSDTYMTEYVPNNIAFYTGGTGTAAIAYNNTDVAIGNGHNVTINDGFLLVDGVTTVRVNGTDKDFSVDASSATFYDPLYASGGVITSTISFTASMARMYYDPLTDFVVLDGSFSVTGDAVFASTSTVDLISDQTIGGEKTFSELTRIGTGTTTYVEGAGDLYVADELEVDGNAYLSTTTIRSNGINNDFSIDSSSATFYDIVTLVSGNMANTVTNGGQLVLSKTGSDSTGVTGIEINNSPSGGYGYKLYPNNNLDYLGFATRSSAATWSDKMRLYQSLSSGRIEILNNGTSKDFSIDATSSTFYDPVNFSSNVVVAGNIIAPKYTRLAGYLNANQLNIPYAGYTKILFDAEEFDSGNEFNTTTSSFTATYAGIYRIHAVIQWYNILADKMYGVSIFKNGAQSKASFMQSSVINSYVSPNVIGLIELEANDIIDFRAYNLDGVGTSDVTAGVASSYFSIERVIDYQ